jgi:hypothetical protein
MTPAQDLTRSQARCTRASSWLISPAFAPSPPFGFVYVTPQPGGGVSWEIQESPHAGQHRRLVPPLRDAWPRWNASGVGSGARMSCITPNPQLCRRSGRDALLPSQGLPSRPLILKHRFRRQLGCPVAPSATVASGADDHESNGAVIHSAKPTGRFAGTWYGHNHFRKTIKQCPRPYMTSSGSPLHHIGLPYVDGAQSFLRHRASERVRRIHPAIERRTRS